MIEAVIRVSLPCSWATEVTADYGAIVNIVEQKPAERGLLHTLAEIDPGRSDPNEVVASLHRNPFIAEVDAIVPREGNILATLRVRDCHACSTLANSECFLTEAMATGTAGLEWRILAPKREAIEELVTTLKDRGLEIELTAIRTAKRSGSLTERQDKVLNLAYRLGYFEFPKKINLSDLAKKLGVAKSTLSEILRTGEEKIVHAYFQGLLKRPR